MTTDRGSQSDNRRRLTRTEHHRLASGGGTPGPAGLAMVTLAGGTTEVDVDYARPDRLSFLAVPLEPSEDDLAVVRRVLGPGTPTDSDRWWMTSTSSTVRPIGSNPLPLLGRLAVGLEELTATNHRDTVLAASLIDLGVHALDLTHDLNPEPSGLELVTAGLARWEHIDPDAWDEEVELLAATTARSSRWVKAVYPHDPHLADRLQILSGALHRRATGQDQVARLVEMAAPAPVAAAPMAAAEGGAARSAPTRERLVPRPTIPVLFGADLDGRVIKAERHGHHLVVHLGGLGEHQAWLRVHRYGQPPQLLAMAPVEDSGRPWRQAVALIGPEVDTEDLLVDVTTRPTEPWRSATGRNVERATALGRDATRLSRRREFVEAQQAWSRCSRAWLEVDDLTRSRTAEDYATQPPVPPWAARDPLLSDLA
ncbi:MAG: hypothetical protein IPG97_11965 [Microthrixaceae bacterium]|nr:hypothetical protein [Microthrixaceae bacterium]